MVQPIVQPQVFISYCWTSHEYEQWVIDLATRLSHDGVKVHFDKWDLKTGHDKYAFMESMVTSKEIDKVLIISDTGYKKKADNREGGVGTETQIITPELYGNTEQEKFIPVLAERDEQGKEIFPAFISSRIYIDLSDVVTYEDNYEKLVRTIFNAPLHKRPPIGKPPAYLFEEDSPEFSTAIILRKMNTAFEKDPKRLKHLWSDFIEAYNDSLTDLRIEVVSESLDEQIVNLIEKTNSLKEDYIKALTLLIESEILESDNIIEFFESIYSFTEFSGSRSYKEIEMDHFKFLINELFLYTIAILLRNKAYSLIADLIYTDYYLNSKFKSYDKSNFCIFRFNLKSLDWRNKNQNLGLVSLHADMLVHRANIKLKDDLLIADILLYFISKISFGNIRLWFPTSYIYLREGRIKLFSKLSSKKHFEVTKSLYNVSSAEELKKIINDLEVDRGYSYYSIPHIKTYINSDEIATLP